MELRPRRLINIMFKFPQTLPTSDHHASSLLPIQMKTLFRNGNCSQYFNTLPPTATGLDHLPAWFLRLGASVFSKPLANLFNKFLSTSTVPHQWKRAFIQPVPKTAFPSSIVTFGQYLLPLSSVGHLNVLSSSSILPFSPLLPLFLSQTNSHFVPQGPPLLRS